MRYIIAVSGGVDSVVLLDMLVKESRDLVVAHFDHGIREESAADAKFVGELAEKYGLVYETKREELGNNASEESARERRYEFLRDVAKKNGAKIVTAHHADDLVETIAINLIRGTGWRGLAVLDSPDIERPLLGMTKKDLLAYAKKHKLQWREDATNKDTKYLRNDVRRKLAALDADAHRLLLLLRDRQVALRHEIDRENTQIIGESPYSRYLFTHAPEPAALELLRAVLVREAGQAPTRPQLARALHAVKVYHAGKACGVGGGISLTFSKSRFNVDVV